MPHTLTVSVYILITNATYPDGFGLHTDYKCHIPGWFRLTYPLEMSHTQTVSVYIPITNATYPDGFGLHTDYKGGMPGRFQFTC